MADRVRTSNLRKGWHENRTWQFGAIAAPENNPTLFAFFVRNRVRTSKLFLSLIIASLFALSGCELMVGGWLMQGAPGVFSESAEQAKDKRIRGLTTGSLASVEGRGWIIEPKAPFTPYTFAASYSEGSSGFYIYATVLNGPSGESKDGALLAELFLSNDPASKFHWSAAENWTKENATIHTKQITYLMGDLVAKPITAISCPRWPGRREPIPDNSESIEVKAGGWQCFRLVFPAEMPSSDSKFSLIVSGIKLGGKEVPDLKLNYDRIPK